MQRVTLALDDDLIEQLDLIMKQRQYQSRSEAMRDLARAGLREAMLEQAMAEYCVAVLSFVFSQDTRNLARRLNAMVLDHHDVVVVTSRMALDHENCLELTVLRGAVAEVRHYADHVLSEKGVRHGRLSILPAHFDDNAHVHPHGGHAHHHIHTG